MFTDSVELTVSSGKGGQGCVAKVTNIEGRK